MDLNLPLPPEPRRGHRRTLVLPRDSGEAVAALLGAVPQLPLPLVARETQAGVLGVGLGTGPWGPLFWLQLCRLAVALVGSLAHPKRCFEVSDVPGRGDVCTPGSSSSSDRPGAAVGWGLWSISS